MNVLNVPNGATIVQAQITTTESCCIVVNAAMILHNSTNVTSYEIERPLGTRRTTQEDGTATGTRQLTHHAAWEVLPAGTYNYYLVNRAGYSLYLYAAWLKVIASDCEG